MVQLSDFLRERLFSSRVGKVLPVILAFTSVGACKAPEPASVNALPGLIWDVERSQGMKREELVRQLGRADVVMIGEVHDNPRHHEIEAELIRALATTRRFEAVALEMLDREQQESLDAIWPEAGVDTVLEETGFDERGWGAERYRPVVAAMLETEVEPLAANLSRADAGQVVHGGWSAIFDAGAEETLALAAVWNESHERHLMEGLRESHCNMLPESMIPGMLAAQRARDAVLADRVLARAEAGVILVAGGEHVRRDYAVPAYVAVRAPRLGVTTVLLMEVDGERPVSEYLDGWPGTAEGPLFDYVWFTPRAEREDPCKIFQRQQNSGHGEASDETR